MTNPFLGIACPLRAAERYEALLNRYAEQRVSTQSNRRVASSDIRMTALSTRIACMSANELTYE